MSIIRFDSETFGPGGRSAHRFRAMESTLRTIRLLELTREPFDFRAAEEAGGYVVEVPTTIPAVKGQAELIATLLREAFFASGLSVRLNGDAVVTS